MDIDNQLGDLLNDPLFQPSESEQPLFDLTVTMRDTAKERLQAEFVAQRRPCENFSDYEQMFKDVHADLKSGRRHLARFSYSSLKEGTFLVISGVLVYIAKILDSKRPNTSHFSFDGRTLTIYENGTESNVMIQTLGKAAYADGYTVTQPDEKSEEELFSNMGVTPEDHQDGYIYVLSSLSSDPAISSVPNLYKIGFTTTPVQQRIANAENEPTYLCAKVKVEATWKTFNLKTHVLENLIHKFFSAVQFQVKLHDPHGHVFTPTEWYVVPLPMIEQAINMIIDRSIVNYRYNPKLQLIEELPEKEHIIAGEFDTTGWNILTLNIYREYFDEILSGEKKIEYRKLKQNKTSLGKYTWVDPTDGKRYLRKYDALRLNVIGKSRQQMIVEVTDTEYDKSESMILYHLGKILSVNIVKPNEDITL